MEQDLIEIFEHYGATHQARKLIEEVLEFYEEVLKYDGTEEAKIRIEKEYGDVENVLEQFRFGLELNFNRIIRSRIQKVNRQLDRMERESEESYE